MLPIFTSFLGFYTQLCELTPLPNSVLNFYSWIYHSMDGDNHPARFVAVQTVLQHMIFFYAVSLPLLALDIFRGPSWLYKYKIQKTVPTTAMLWRCFRTVLINQFLLLIPISCFGLYDLYRWRGCQMSPALMPSIVEILVDILICVVVEEILFYYSHRALHSRWLYGPVHKQHHQFTAPIGMAAVYAHPVEFLLSNLTPLVCGAVLAKSHMFTMWVWYGAAIIVTIFHHCGYAFPFLIGNTAPNDHDWHHEKFEVHYGLLGWLDRLHGTNLIQGKTREEIIQARSNKPEDSKTK